MLALFAPRFGGGCELEPTSVPPLGGGCPLQFARQLGCGLPPVRGVVLQTSAYDFFESPGWSRLPVTGYPFPSQHLVQNAAK